jgi:hypothetical protein
MFQTDELDPASLGINDLSPSQRSGQKQEYIRDKDSHGTTTIPAESAYEFALKVRSVLVRRSNDSTRMRILIRTEEPGFAQAGRGLLHDAVPLKGGADIVMSRALLPERCANGSGDLDVESGSDVQRRGQRVVT